MTGWLHRLRRKYKRLQFLFTSHQQVMAKIQQYAQYNLFIPVFYSCCPSCARPIPSHRARAAASDQKLAKCFIMHLSSTGQAIKRAVADATQHWVHNNHAHSSVQCLSFVDNGRIEGTTLWDRWQWKGNVARKSLDFTGACHEIFMFHFPGMGANR